MTIDALLSLGGNVGDRKATMDAAVARLAALPETTVIARSSYYRTEPEGPIEQPWFLNTAVALRTGLDAVALASTCRAIETALGRDRAREIPSGPRPIDIDLIACGSVGRMTGTADRLDRRAFVLVPLAEIAPSVVIDGASLAEHAAAVGAASVVRLDWTLPLNR